MGSTLGVPVCADECTSRQLRVSFARILVEIDITKPLPSCLSVDDPSGKILEQQVVYEWTPLFASLVIRWVCSKQSTGKKKVVKNPKKASSVPQQEDVQVPASDTSLVVVDAVTPMVQAQPVNDDADEGWKVVTRKDRDKGKRAVSFSSEILQSNSYLNLVDEDMTQAIVPIVNGLDGQDKECNTSSNQ